jgi:hypothetical protein
MFERFTERARQVVGLARKEARTPKHNYIGTEHILPGAGREEEEGPVQGLEEDDSSEKLAAMSLHDLSIVWARTVIVVSIALLVACVALAGVLATFNGEAPADELATAIAALVSHAQAAKI